MDEIESWCKEMKLESEWYDEELYHCPNCGYGFKLTNNEIKEIKTLRKEILSENS